MKILLINNYSHKKGGVESVFYNTIKLLKERGNQVISFAIKTNQLESFDVNYSINKPKSSFQKFFFKESRKVLQEILIKEKPEIAHIHNIIGGISPSILPILKKFKIPIVASIHDLRLLCPTWVMINGKGKICEKCKTGRYFQCLLNKCHPSGYLKSLVVAVESYLRDLFYHHRDYYDGYIFNSQFSMNKFLEFYPTLISKKLYVIYNFIDHYSEKIYRGNYFFYFGRLDREKGVKTLIEAFKQIPEFKLKIAGKGEYESFLGLNESSNIEYVGFKKGKELIKLIEGSSFVIIPSECYETLSMAGIESLSLSKPIITTQLGGLNEVCIDGFNGFKFIAKNVESLINVVKKAASLSEEEYYIFSRNAYHYARENFNPEKHYNNLMKAYKEIIENRH